LLVKKIRNECWAKHPRLRTYRNDVWDLINNFFLAFNIQFLPREGDRKAGSLAIAARNFNPPKNLLLRYEVELRHIPSIPNNVKNYQVFEDYEQMKRFIDVVGEFTSSIIDKGEEKEADQEPNSWEDIVVGHKILQLKGNTIPRGLVLLEILFNKNNVASKPTSLEIDEMVEDCNTGSEDEPQMVKLSKGIPSYYKQRYLNLFKTNVSGDG